MPLFKVGSRYKFRKWFMYGLKAQKLLAQGSALGNYGRKPFRACNFYELLPLQVVLPTFSLRAASSLSFGRGDKAAESGDVDYEYHHIIKGLYATCSSWYIDPCQPS